MKMLAFNDLGGAGVHSKKSGVAHLVFPDEENTLMGVRQMLAYLPSNNMENSPEMELIGG